MKDNVNLGPLNEETLSADPIAQCVKWFKEAEEHADLIYPEAACLSTLATDGYPEGRVVLLKFFDQRGFVFYTNSQSAKGKALAQLNKGSLTFYWEALRRQLRITGDITPVSAENSDAYFKSRARLSQIGAWASLQSEPLADRATLDKRVAEFEKKFADGPVPRPPHWIGYRLAPVRIEFWQERDNRLHDRFLFTRQGNGWDATRLYP